MRLSRDQLLKLQVLCSPEFSDKIKRSVISTSSDNFVCCLLSILLSIVLGKLSLGPEQFSTLKRQSKLLHHLVSDTENLTEKRRQLGLARSLHLVSLAIGFILPQLAPDSEWNFGVPPTRSKEEEAARTPTPESPTFSHPPKSLFHP